MNSILNPMEDNLNIFLNGRHSKLFRKMENNQNYMINGNMILTFRKWRIPQLFFQMEDDFNT